MDRDIPIWWRYLLGMAAFLFVMQPYAPKIGEVPLQVGLTWFLLFWRLIFNANNTIKAVGRYTILQRIIVFTITIIFTVKYYYEEVTYIVYFQFLTGIALSLLAIIISESIKSIKVVFGFVFIASLLSAILCLLQFLGLADWSWKYTAYHERRMILPSGLEYNPVALTYAVLPPCIVLLVGYFYQKANKIKIEFIPKILSMPILSLLLLSLVLSQSRSGLLAVVICLLLVALICIKLKKRFIPISTVTSIAIIFLMFSLVNNSVFDGIINKAGKIDSDMRTAGTWSIFMPVLLEYPLGVPKDVRDIEHTSHSAVGGHSKKNYEEAMRKTDGYDPHNIFITAAVYFGLPVAFLMAIFYMNILYGAFKLVMKNRLSDVNDINLLIFLVINLSIVIHGWFHNASIVFGEMRLWFWLGFLISFNWISRAKQFKRH
jgi:hypothetical protein